MAARKRIRLEGAGVVNGSHRVALITAYRAGLRVLPPTWGPHSSSPFSPAQLFALLVLRAICNTSYRETQGHIEDYFVAIREWIGITAVPSYSTLARAARALSPHFDALHAAMLDMAIEKRFLASA